MYKAAEGNFRQKERDVVKIDERRGVVYALYGVENQTAVNCVMPVRNMGYDYASYEKAARDLKSRKRCEWCQGTICGRNPAGSEIISGCHRGVIFRH